MAYFMISLLLYKLILIIRAVSGRHLSTLRSRKILPTETVRPVEVKGKNPLTVNFVRLYVS
jgi:hypothetical protein